jgi:TolB-like protein
MRRLAFAVVCVGLQLSAAPLLAVPAKPKPPATAVKKPAAKDAAKDAAAAEAARLEAEAQAKAQADAAAAAAAAAKVDADIQAAAKAEADAEAARQQARQKALSTTGLQGRVRVLAETLAITLKRLPGDHRDQRFAVVPFEDVGDEAKQRSLGVVVGDLLTTDLVRDHRLDLVERAQLATVLNELALQQTGAVDDAQVLQVGKTAGARGLVVGRISDGGDAFIVSARALDTETGVVLAAEEARLPKAELIAFSADAVVLKSRSGAAFRSLVAPGWGQAYNGDVVKGLLVGSAVGGLALATITTAGIGAWQGFVVYPSIEKSADVSAAEAVVLAADTRERANTLLTAAAILGGVTVVGWGANVIEAWVSGVDVESLDAALAKN